MRQAKIFYSNDSKKASIPTTAKSFYSNNSTKASVSTTAKSFYFNDSKKGSITTTAKKLIILPLILSHDLVLGNILFNVGHWPSFSDNVPLNSFPSSLRIIIYAALFDMSLYELESPLDYY